MRTLPWWEHRGSNPYLLVADNIKSSGASVRGHVLDWLIHEEAPVLLEPLYKLLIPIKFLFDRRAGFWDRLYLVLVLLVTLAVWGFFAPAFADQLRCSSPAMNGSASRRRFCSRRNASSPTSRPRSFPWCSWALSSFSS